MVFNDERLSIVHEYENAFQYCVDLESIPEKDTPSIPSDKKNAINRNHFNDNQYLMMVLNQSSICLNRIRRMLAKFGNSYYGAIPKSAIWTFRNVLSN